ncbi:MAG: hypothetical protein GC160_21860 [Acidobacteria bacterium]|nr:hypothetical protein [Acidobacteriota bacterium]
MDEVPAVSQWGEMSVLMPLRRWKLSFLIGLLLIGAPTPGALQAQTPGEYRLGPDDLLAITAVGSPELASRPWRVDPTGGLRLPLIGAVPASGRTPEELETAIAEKLGRYVLSPKVSVAVEEIGSRPVSVLGAVRSPGLQQLRGNRTVAEALSAAGGLAPDAGAALLLTRPRENGEPPIPAELDAGGKFYVARLPLAPLLDGSAPELNIAVAPHDVLSVPRAELFYVIGAVERAGAFPLRDGRPATITEALALAGGLAQHADSRRARILSRDGAGGRTETIVDCKAILAGEGPDRPLSSDQVLFVPHHGGKAIASQIGRAALSIGTGAAIWVAAR